MGGKAGREARKPLMPGYEITEKALAGLLTALAVALGATWTLAGTPFDGLDNIEVVRLDEVAPEDRSDGVPIAPPGLLPPGPPGAGAEELAEALRGVWRAIPAYSPVNGASRLTSNFGWRRSPVTGRREFHGGIDLAAARGTPIVAPADGIVERVFTGAASGLVLVLEHGNGMETVFGHLDAVLVAEGQDVHRGQLIGRLGSSGWRSTGPHLHYGIRLARKYVNPRRYLFEGGSRSR